MHIFLYPFGSPDDRAQRGECHANRSAQSAAEFPGCGLHEIFVHRFCEIAGCLGVFTYREHRIAHLPSPHVTMNRLPAMG
jgi:hypothetical protein